MYLLAQINVPKMNFTTLSKYYLGDWWTDVDFRLFPCWFDFRFSYSYLTWGTGGLGLASTIILVLQASWLTKRASHPKLICQNLLSKCEHIRIKLRIYSELLNKSLTETFLFLCREFYWFYYWILKMFL